MMRARDLEPVVAAVTHEDVDARSIASERLWNAVHAQDGAAVLRSLAGGAHIDARRCRNETPLVCAASRGWDDICHILVSHGADVHAVDDQRMTPLHWTANRGHTAMAGLLLDHGAQIEAKDGGGRTPLHWAAQNGRHNTCRLLIERGAQVNAPNFSVDTPMLMAVVGRHTATCEVLLAAGGHASGIGRTISPPLHAAVRGGDVPTVEALLRHHADIQGTNIRHETPLVVAVQRACDDRDGTPAHHASMQMVQLLLARGADPNAAMDMAIATNSVSCTHALLDAGAHVDRQEQSSLTHAWVHGAVDVFRALLARGADVNGRDVGGTSVLDRLHSSGDGRYNAIRRDLARMVIAQGADPLARSSLGGFADRDLSTTTVLLTDPATPPVTIDHIRFHAVRHLSDQPQAASRLLELIAARETTS